MGSVGKSENGMALLHCFYIIKRPKASTILLLALICFCFAASAQTAHQKDSIQVFKLLEQAELKFLDGTFTEVLRICEEAIDYANNHGNDFGLAYAYIKQSEAFIELDDLNLAQKAVSDLSPLISKLGDPLIEAIYNLLQAQILLYRNQIKESFPYFEKAISGHFENNLSSYAALAYNDYGYALGVDGQTDLQVTNLVRSLEILEAVSPDNAAELAVTLNNISIAYYGMGKLDKAIEFALLSIEYRKEAGDISRMALGYCNLSQFYRGKDQAEVEKYLKLCEKYAEQSQDEARMTQVYVTSALLFSDKGDRENAMAYEEKAVALLLKNNQDPSMLARRYLSLGMHAVALEKDSLEIMQYFNKSLQLTSVDHNKLNFRDLYEQLAYFYRSKNDFRKAFDFYNLHILYRDSIINEKTIRNIAELETKYEAEKKDNEILRLSNSEQLKALEIQRQEAILARNFLEAEQKEKEITVLTQEQELNELRILQQNEKLIKQDLVAKTKEQQLNLAATEKLLQDRQLSDSKKFRNISYLVFALLCVLVYFLFARYQLKRKIEEQEAMLAIRGNIAKDLHDEIGSTLTSIKILSEVSTKHIADAQTNISPYLSKITEQSAEAQQGISDIVWAVNPENDKLGNLVVRMREYLAQTLEPKNIHIEMKIDEQLLNRHIAMNRRRDFLLMFKEVINNIAKHSQADHVIIRLEQHQQLLKLFISDNGNGFDTTIKSSSNGLKNLLSRAKSINGTFEINSILGQGTNIDIGFPAT